MNRRRLAQVSPVVCFTLCLLACGGGSGSSPGSNSALNAAPSANAGADQQVQSQALVALDGSASSDSDGTIRSYAWTQSVGPAVSLSDPTAARPMFIAPSVASSTVLTFTLTVTDNGGASANAMVNITVLPEGTITGLVDFDAVPFNPVTNGLSYAQTFSAPVRGAVVEAISASDRSTILASGITDDAGHYSLSFPVGTAYFLRVKAQMLQTGSPSWNFRVVDNTDANALYALDSDDLTNDGGVHNLHAASGWNGTSYDPNGRNAAPFAILNALYESFHLALAANPGLQFPPLDVHWSKTNHESDSFSPATGGVGTYYRSATDSSAGIYLLGTENVDTDEYDEHVIIHEWGHYFQDKFSRDDSVGGTHSLDEKLDFRVAFSEGWGNAFSGMATDDAYYRDSGGAGQASGFSINLESNNTSTPSRNGWFSESSVHSILYDIFDTSSDGVDSVALGFAPIYSVMTNEAKTSDALSGIFSFITALKARNPGVATGIDAIVSGQGIASSTMDDFGSTETNNGGAAENLPIYRNLTVNGSSINVCSSTANGEANKLGNRRYLRFTVPHSATIQVVAQAAVGKDPDLVLHQKGQQTWAISNSSATGKQTLSRTVAAGTLVLEVFDAAAVDKDTATAGNACMDVTVTGS